MKHFKIWAYFTLFFVLSLFSTLWILKSSNFSWHLLKDLRHIPSFYLGMAVFSAFAIYVADAFRYFIYARALGEKISFKLSLEASIANFFFSWITPIAILGMPATIFILKRRGVKLENAVLISTGKSLIGSAYFLLFAFLIILFGFGPSGLEGSFISLILFGGGIYILLLLIPFLSAFYPAPFYKLISLCKIKLQKFEGSWIKWPMHALSGLEDAILKLEGLLSKGRWWIIPIMLIHTIYYMTFLAPGIFLAMGLGQHQLSSLLGPMTVFTAASLMSPTPGGAGVAEAMIKLCFGALLNGEGAILTAVGFRFLTFYFQTGVGLLWFLRLIFWQKNLVNDLDKAL